MLTQTCWLDLSSWAKRSISSPAAAASTFPTDQCHFSHWINESINFHPIQPRLYHWASFPSTREHETHHHRLSGWVLKACLLALCITEEIQIGKLYCWQAKHLWVSSGYKDTQHIIIKTKHAMYAQVLAMFFSSTLSSTFCCSLKTWNPSKWKKWTFKAL